MKSLLLSLLSLLFFVSWSEARPPIPLPLEERPETKAKKSKKKKPILSKKTEDPRSSKKIGSKTTLEPSTDAAEILYPVAIGETVSSMVVTLANRLDSFFGDERSDDEQNGSTLRLTPSYTFYDKKPDVTELGININLKLKNLEAKAKEIEAKLRNEVITTAGEIGGVGGTSAAAKKATKKDFWHFNFESKLAARPAIYYSGKFRLRRNLEFGPLVHHIAASAGWDTDVKWSQVNNLTSDLAITDEFLFRFLNESTWRISKQEFQTIHGPSLIQNVNKYNSVSYNIRYLFAVDYEEFQHTNSIYSINFRHSTPSKRIFIDLIPSYAYPRDDFYHEVRSIELRIEYFFGDLG